LGPIGIPTTRGGGFLVENGNSIKSFVEIVFVVAKVLTIKKSNIKVDGLLDAGVEFLKAHLRLLIERMTPSIVGGLLLKAEVRFRWLSVVDLGTLHFVLPFVENFEPQFEMGDPLPSVSAAF
jgi:hypothetical protein